MATQKVSLVDSSIEILNHVEQNASKAKAVGEELRAILKDLAPSESAANAGFTNDGYERQRYPYSANLPITEWYFSSLIS